MVRALHFYCQGRGFSPWLGKLHGTDKLGRKEGKKGGREEEEKQKDLKSTFKFLGNFLNVCKFFKMIYEVEGSGMEC